MRCRYFSASTIVWATCICSFLSCKGKAALTKLHKNNYKPCTSQSDTTSVNGSLYCSWSLAQHASRSITSSASAGGSFFSPDIHLSVCKYKKTCVLKNLPRYIRLTDTDFFFNRYRVSAYLCARYPIFRTDIYLLFYFHF